MSVVTAGVPQARASRSTVGSPSRSPDSSMRHGSTSIAHRFSASWTSVEGSGPRKTHPFADAELLGLPTQGRVERAVADDLQAHAGPLPGQQCDGAEQAVDALLGHQPRDAQQRSRIPAGPQARR